MLRTALFSTLLTLTTAHPLPQTYYTPPNTITPLLLETIEPTTSTCTDFPFPLECADSTRAAPAIISCFTKYQITTPGEQTALIALMLFESGSFKYNKNHFPGVPGQGTKNMQSPAFNLQYATELFGAEKANEAQAQGPEAVLDLVSGDQESFGSAAWFLSSQPVCQGVREGLAAGTPEGWGAYLADCVGTTDTEARDVIWRKAIEVMF